MYYYRTFLVVFFLLVLHSTKTHAQFGVSHEIGVFAGPANFLTDYGERWNIRNNISNAGLGIGLLHFMHLGYSEECNYRTTESWIRNHLRIRNELNWLRTDLEHYGPVAQKNNLGGQQLRAMHGTTDLFEIGTLLEFHPLRIRDFTNMGYWFSPYIAGGAHYVNYKPDAYSDLGSLENPKNVFHTFVGGINLERGSTYALVGAIGARVRLGWNHDLMVEGRMHAYGNDWIDGLNIDAPQNKYNDTVAWLTIGYVYYINF